MPSNFPLNSRQNYIIALARAAGRVLVDELAIRLDVTTQTIRRDLNELCERQILSRVHGGAVISSSLEDISYGARKQLAAVSKRAIGEAAAALIPDDASLFIYIGTTAEEVAWALTQHKRLFVITNNINVAMALYANPGINVVVSGGPVRSVDGAVVGSATVDMIRQFKVDYAVIGASALDESGTLLYFDPLEVAVSRAIIENANKVILVCDQSKFGHKAPVRGCALADIDIFVTDQMRSATLRALCAANNVQLIETSAQDQI